jgi:AsmA-like C-terminal region
VSDTLTEAVVGAEPLAEARPKRAWTRWPKRLLLLAMALWAVDLVSPAAIGHTPMKRWLTQRLEAAFGRPVEVASYSLSLWSGPQLEARGVTVAEDARFGQEYFLRADSLTVRLRLRSLLLGRLEAGTLSLSHPSLNFVRSAEGDWNLAGWLPKPGAAAGAARSSGETPAQRALRFRRIEVDSGRINFKRGDEKLPFAFTGVNGAVESENAGRWRIDLEAVPSRAAAIVQQPGLLHVSGDLGGLSSRLRPASLVLDWRDASIPDVLRIARGYDYGVRGALNVSVTARTEATDWVLHTRANLVQLHRWDLAARGDNPSVNFAAKVKLSLERSMLEIDDAKLDTANSQVRASIGATWGTAAMPAKRPTSPVGISVSRASVDFGELLAWVRAFHPGVADDLAVHGFAVLKGDVEGWPLHLVNATAASEGAELTGAHLRVPVELGPVQARYDHGGMYLAPVAITFGAAGSAPGSVPGSVLRADAASKEGKNASRVLHVAGNVAHVRDVVAAAGALGWSISRGWDVTGPMRCDLRWQDAGTSIAIWHGQPTGYLELGEPGTGGGATLRAPFINEPIEQIRARAEIRPGMRHVALTSAEAFGARWSGTFDRAEDEGWRFALAADHLTAANLDRWLNPQWRQSFLERALPFLSASGPANAGPENLRASGGVSVEQFTVAPVTIRKLAGELSIDGRRLHLTDAKGEMYGGTASGSFDAMLQSAPAYRARVSFSGVNLAALTAGSPALANLFGGSAWGEISMDARGAGRGEILSSLACEGSARVQDAEVRGFDLMASLRDAARAPVSGKSTFREASAVFSCGEGRIRFKELHLSGPAGKADASGFVDFARNLDLRVRVASAGPSPADVATARTARASYLRGETFQVTGPLAAPQVEAVAAAPGRR